MTESDTSTIPAATTADERERTVVERIEIAGGQLVDKVRELIEDASARRVIVRRPDGDELLSIPLTVGVVAGGLVARFAPILGALGVIAALFGRVKLEVIRVVAEEEDVAKEEDPEPT